MDEKEYEFLKSKNENARFLLEQAKKVRNLTETERILLYILAG